MLLLSLPQGAILFMARAKQTTASVCASSAHHESYNRAALLCRSFCRVLSPRQKTALWGTTGIHKYSGLKKFIEFVVKDLWWAAEVVQQGRGGL